MAVLLRHTSIIKLTRLLDMMYKPAELAEEIDVAPDTIYRSYLPAGLPYTRDETGDIWVHGLTFVAWAKETIALRKTRRHGLADGHAWCMKCNQPVQLINPTVKVTNRYIELLQAACPHCGRTVNRAQARQGVHHD